MSSWITHSRQGSTITCKDAMHQIQYIGVIMKLDQLLRLPLAVQVTKECLCILEVGACVHEMPLDSRLSAMPKHTLIPFRRCAR